MTFSMTCLVKLMGNKAVSATKEEEKRNRAIEDAIKNDIAMNRKIFRLLLLGAGDSGKSTIVKQMKILHMGGFTNDEIEHSKQLVIQQIFDALTTILGAMVELSIKFEDPAKAMSVAVVLNAERNWRENKGITRGEWKCMEELWPDGGVQSCYRRSSEYQLYDSAKYFLDSIDRISHPAYVPSYDDILHAKAQTLGIVEISFALRNLNLIIIDVGGQRSQRKKWIHCFDNVNSLIFITAISEYNQVLLEDSTVNRMRESITLFATVINSKWFLKTPTLLFLNKKDLFEGRLKTHSLKNFFPEYQGLDEYEEASDFLQHYFEKQLEDQTKKIYCHKTCATDTKNVEFVMNAAFDIILAKNMNQYGFS